jgi:hypothetical protein
VYIRGRLAVPMIGTSLGERNKNQAVAGRWGKFALCNIDNGLAPGKIFAPSVSVLFR